MKSDENLSTDYIQYFNNFNLKTEVKNMRNIPKIFSEVILTLS